MDGVAARFAREDIKETLLQLETLLWRGNAELNRQFVLEDAVLVHGDGENAIYEDNAIEGMGRLCREWRNWRDVRFDETDLVSLDADTAIISYRASGTTRAGRAPKVVECRSMYMRKNGQMRLAFHHQGKARNR